MADKHTRKTWITVGVALVMALLTTIVVFQNTEAVKTRVLFGTVSMPHALLLALAFGSGVLVGAVLCRKWSRRKQEA